MRAMWDCFHTRRSEVPYGWGWEKMYERSGEGEEEREMVEWGGLERMAGVLVCCLVFWLSWCGGGWLVGYVSMWRESGVWCKGRADKKQ